MKKISISSLLFAGILVCSISNNAKAQTWVGSGGTTLYSVNSSSNVTPIRVGIGVSTPAKQFQVHSTGVQDDNVLISGGSPSVYFSHTATIAPIPYTTPTARIALASWGGNFLATATPGDFVVQAMTQSKNLLFGVGMGADDNGVERMRITASGQVGINTISPTATFHSNGTARLENLPYGYGNIVVIDNSGNLYNSYQPVAAAKEVDELKAQIAELKEAVAALKAQQTISAPEAKAAAIVPAATTVKATSLQISPNPTAGTTTIKYNLPAATQKASILITDMSGNVVKRQTLSGTGKGALLLDASSLGAAGTYIYSLEVDGVAVESKKIVVTR